jgi:hypothetical protein
MDKKRTEKRIGLVKAAGLEKERGRGEKKKKKNWSCI